MLALDFMRLETRLYWQHTELPGSALGDTEDRLIISMDSGGV